MTHNSQIARELAEPTVDEALRWLRKLEHLTSDAAKLIHMKGFIENMLRRQVELLAEKAERQSHEDAGNTSQYKRFKFVAAWLRSQIGEP